jgi:hypothetical protein
MMGDARVRTRGRWWRARVLLAGVIAAVIALLGVAPDALGDGVTPVAQTVQATSVYANPTVAPTLSPGQLARVRGEIGRHDPGRVGIAVVSRLQAAGAGGVSGFANALAQRLGRPGTVVVVDGAQLWVVTSYANTTAAENAVRAAFTSRHGLVGELLASVDGIAAIDPGRGTRPAGSTTTTTTATKTTATAPAPGTSSVGAPTTGGLVAPAIVAWVVVIAGVAALLAILAAGWSRRLFSLPAFWTGRFLPVLGAGLGVLIAVVWLDFGGLPRGYDTYGRVSVPGQRVLALPAGEVTLDFENGLNLAGTDNASEIHTPPGMVVRVTPVTRPAAPLTVDRVPTWLFESDGQTYGHKPWGRIHVPLAGRYLVETGRDSHPLASVPNPQAPATAAPFGGPTIAAGEAPWTPLGSPLVGALAAGLLFFAAFCVPHLLVVLWTGAGRARPAEKRGVRRPAEKRGVRRPARRGIRRPARRNR